jgi:twitching motility protein PilI
MNGEVTTTAYALLLDFERRALDHRAEAAETNTGPALWRGLCFGVAGIETVVSISEISEILVPPALTFVPGARPWLRGIANLRGTLLTVVDIGHFLFGTRTPFDDRNRVLVVRQRGAAATGLLVDSVLGQRGFEETAAVVPDEVVDPRLLPYVPYAYGDAAGEQFWPVLSLPTLLRAQMFLDAAA